MSSKSLRANAFTFSLARNVPLVLLLIELKRFPSKVEKEGLYSAVIYEIDPCPFCGTGATVNDDSNPQNVPKVEVVLHPDTLAWYRVTCFRCSSHSEWFSTPEGAIERWNMRTAPKEKKVFRK